MVTRSIVVVHFVHLYCRRDYVNKKFRNSLLCYWWRFSSAPCHLTASCDLFWHHQWIRHLVKRLHFNVSVVFDGYDSGPSTQDGTHTRRRSGRVAHDIDLPKYTRLCQDGANYKQRSLETKTDHRVDSHIAWRWLWSNSTRHLTIVIYLFNKTYLYRYSTQWDNINSVLQCCSVTS